MAQAVPAFAASVCDPVAAQWYTKSRIVYTDPNYSTSNFDATVTAQSSPPGASSIQHWVSGISNPPRTTDKPKLNWRIPIGWPGDQPNSPTMAGAVMRIPKDPSWKAMPTAVSWSGVAAFVRFAGDGRVYTQDMPKAAITITGTEIVLVFPDQIPAGSAAVYQFSVEPVGGLDAVLRGDTFTAQATTTFTAVPDCTVR